MQVDFDVLKRRIQTLVGEGVADRKGTSAANAGVRLFKPLILPLIESEVMRSEILAKGLKIIDGCDECLKLATLKKAKVVGSGFNGTVFNMGKGRAMKVEVVADAHYIDGPIMAGKVAERMGTLGVGPKVHSWRLCGDQFNTYLVIEMDLIKGMNVRDWRQASQKITAAKLDKIKLLLNDKILKMHKAGYFHTDLNPGNVIIDKKGVPWIIDFSYMVSNKGNKKHSAEQDNLDFVKILENEPEAAFRGPLPRWSALATQVFERLAEEGTLISNNHHFVDMKFSEFGRV